jgi:hypothetical protein
MKKVTVIFFFILIDLIGATTFAWAEQLSIRFDDYEVQEQRLSTNLVLTGDISYDTIDAIRNGITAKFYITLQLSTSSRFLARSRSTFLETVESFNISYDVWENTYLLRDNGRRNTHVAGNSGEIVQSINAVISPQVMNLGAIDWKDRLYLRARIKIQTIRLFPPFGIFLLFFDPWNFESGWEQMEVVEK